MLGLLYYTSKTKKKQELCMIKILPALDKDQPWKITTPKATKNILSWPKISQHETKKKPKKSPKKLLFRNEV